MPTNEGATLTILLGGAVCLTRLADLAVDQPRITALVMRPYECSLVLALDGFQSSPPTNDCRAADTDVLEHCLFIQSHSACERPRPNALIRLKFSCVF